MSLYTEFDHYNPPIGPDQTPYDYFKALRDEAMATQTPIGWSNEYGGFWVVTGWPEAQEIQRNPKTFSSTEVTFPPFGTPGGRPVMLSSYDDPAHMRYRRLLQVPFSPAQAASMTDYFRKDANLLIDQMIEKGRVDIVETFTAQVPGRMTAVMIGAPPEEGDIFRTWVHSMAMGVHKDPEGARKHIEDMDKYWERLLADRRKNPGDDVMSQVINAEIDGERLTEEELYDFFVILLIGGIDNTVYLLGDMLWHLAWDHDLRRRLRREPELLETAIDEFLRMYSPNMSARITTEAVDIGGIRMEAGQHLVNFHPIINRDPRQFEDPDTFVPDRSPNRHFALGLGIHRCLGTHLIRVEASVMAQEFMRRIPEWNLDPERPSKWFPGQTGGFGEVPIVFPPGGGDPAQGWSAESQIKAG